MVNKQARATTSKTCTAPTSEPAAVVDMSLELEWYASDLEYVLATESEWYAADLEYTLATESEWYAADLEYIPSVRGFVDDPLLGYDPH